MISCGKKMTHTNKRVVSIQFWSGVFITMITELLYAYYSHSKRSLMGGAYCFHQENTHTHYTGTQPINTEQNSLLCHV